MADYSLGGGFSSGYGDGGLGLGGGYDGGGNTNPGGQGLGGGTYSGGGYSLGDGYSNSGGSGYGANWGGAIGGGYWDEGGGFSPNSFPATSYTAPSYSSSSFSSPAASYTPSNFDYSPASAYSGPSTELGATPWGGEVGLKMPGSTGTSGLGLQGTDNYDDWAENPWMKGLKKLGIGVLSAHPATRVPMALYNAYNAFQAGKPGQAAGQAVGALTGNGLYGGLANIGVNAARGQNVSGDVSGLMGGMIGSGLGGAIAGPFGAAVGGDLGSYGFQAMNKLGGPTTGQANPSIKDGGSNGLLDMFNSQQQVGKDYTPSASVEQALAPYGGASGTSDKAPTDYGKVVGAGLAGLMQLYALNQSKGMSKDQAMQAAQNQQANQLKIDALTAQINGPSGIRPPSVRSPNFNAINAKMEGMFGAGSSAAQQLRQTLDRKDAAAGRRSQYGPREVQLLSALTQMRAQAEPGYMNAEISAANAANQGAFNIYNTQSQERQQQLQRLIAAQQMGMTNSTAGLSSQFQAQNNADTRRMQTAATLYGVGKETGAFDYLGSLFN
jgi:hypothetical protein